MDTSLNGSISRGTLSRFFKRAGSESSGSGDLQQTTSSHKTRKLGTLFSKEGRKLSLSQSIEHIASLSSSPNTPITPTTPTTPGTPTTFITPTTFNTPNTPATPRTPIAGTPKGRRRGTVLEAIAPEGEEEELRSYFDDDTEDEEERNTLRARYNHVRMMAKVTNGFKSKSKVHVGEKKGTEEVGEATKKQGTELHRELHKYENIKVQTTVFGRDTSQETIDDDEMDFTGTFHYFAESNRKYVRPGRNEVLHIRDGGREYITVERINGVCSITAGVFECIVAELAHPVLTPHGNITMLKTVFDQLKTSVGNSAQEVNLVHFILHWIKEKPEDFSWCNEILELRFQIFRYVLDTFKKTVLSRNLYGVSVRHHKLEEAYKIYAKHQKKGWVSFRDIKMSYARPTKCDLVPVGLSTINIDDLTNYISLVDVILFRDGCEMGALDSHWKEKAQMEIPREYTSNDFFSERQAPFWWPVERIERILERQRMIKHWVALEIMHLDTSASRTQMIKVFISVAGNLLEMSDFHGVFCIMEGLQCPMVRNLERSWEDIGYLHLRLFKQLREIVNDKNVYHQFLGVESGNPVTPYYAHFLDEVTDIHNSKDHSARIKSTGTSKMHLDAPLSKFGVWDTEDRKAPATTSEDGTPKIPISLDFQKYRKLLSTVQSYQKRVQPEYKHCGEITSGCFVLKLHLVGMKNFVNLAEISDMTSPELKGRLNGMSQLIETRILEAWSLQPKNDIPPVYRDGDATRCLVLQNLQKALGNCA
ncbi:uncharacterized protein LAJ45_08367 [Morchella importuna]|uniref:uncharacterized protein n=1 Tax=Morchella importuna TaxID=1174673 RepID=UPI001E8DCEE2|nr:uncharacterized protein LAJ45_08367 [Morchella importuna]KAH8147540.1 hypothetical protein LAJ45_08367 [Morchella importuna]